MVGYAGKKNANNGVVYMPYIPIQVIDFASVIFMIENQMKIRKRKDLIALCGCKSGGEISLKAAAIGIKKLTQAETYLVCSWYATVLAHEKLSSKWLVDYAKSKGSIFRIGRTFANKFNTDKNKSCSKVFSNTMFKLAMIYWNTTISE